MVEYLEDTTILNICMNLDHVLLPKIQANVYSSTMLEEMRASKCRAFPSILFMPEIVQFGGNVHKVIVKILGTHPSFVCFSTLII